MTAAELTQGARRFLGLLYRDEDVYLAHAARGRYAVVQSGRLGFERIGAVASGTVTELRDAGLITVDTRRDNWTPLGRYKGRRHLDSSRGERIQLTEEGCRVAPRPRPRK